MSQKWLSDESCDCMIKAPLESRNIGVERGIISCAGLSDADAGVMTGVTLMLLKAGVDNGLGANNGAIAVLFVELALTFTLGAMNENSDRMNKTPNINIKTAIFFISFLPFLQSFSACSHSC